MQELYAAEQSHIELNNDEMNSIYLDHIFICGFLFPA